eukprot:58192-Amphidinium_carterae.1
MSTQTNIPARGCDMELWVCVLVSVPCEVGARQCGPTFPGASSQSYSAPFAYCTCVMCPSNTTTSRYCPLDQTSNRQCISSDIHG